MEQLPAYYYTALGEMQRGVAEFPGSASNPQIEEYHKSTGLGASDDNVAWCSSFLNWCMQQNGQVGSGSPAARSWMKWGVESEPEHGAVCVLWRVSRDDWRGHVGLVHRIDWSKGTVWVLGGNEQDAIRIVEYPFDRVLGYRKPKRARDSSTLKAAAVSGGAGTTMATMQVVDAVTETVEKTSEVAEKTGIFGSTGGTIALTMVLTAIFVVGLIWICRERLIKLSEDGR